MEREKFATEFGSHKFEIKTYATAREANAIQQVLLGSAKMELVGQEPRISEFNPAIQQEVEQEMIRQMVLSLDGTADNIVDRCLDLPAETYDDLVSHLDALVSKKKK